MTPDTIEFGAEGHLALQDVYWEDHMVYAGHPVSVSRMSDESVARAVEAGFIAPTCSVLAPFRGVDW